MTTLQYGLIVVGLAASTVLVLFLSMLAVSVYRQRRADQRVAERFAEFDRKMDEDYQ